MKGGHGLSAPVIPRSDKEYLSEATPGTPHLYSETTQMELKTPVTAQNPSITTSRCMLGFVRQMNASVFGCENRCPVTMQSACSWFQLLTNNCTLRIDGAQTGFLVIRERAN